MPLVMVAKEQAVHRDMAQSDGSSRHIVDYFGKQSGNNIGPEAFVIEVRDRTLGAHFHGVDQFQVLLGSKGSRYQRQLLPHVTLHYADAYATYGPLSGEDPPLRFFTLRALASEVTGFMPADRDQLAYRGRRNMHVGLPDQIDVMNSGEATSTQLFAADEDGFGALMHCAGPAGAISVMRAEQSGGQYVYVADGTVIWSGREFGEESLGWLGKDDDTTCLKAGTNGCRVLTMQFPDPPSTLDHEIASGWASTGVGRA